MFNINKEVKINGKNSQTLLISTIQEDNNQTIDNKNFNEQLISPDSDRNKRVRQKNRYFSDFHCINLTKGQRATTKEGDTYEYKYCKKCNAKTQHEYIKNCEKCKTCLIKKIVNTKRRGRPPSINKSKICIHTANNKKQLLLELDINDNILNKSKPNNDIDKISKLDTWSCDDVAEFLKSNGFKDEAELFKAQLVDGITLLLMERADFTNGLKLKLGPALRICDQINKLKNKYYNIIEESKNC